MTIHRTCVGSIPSGGPVAGRLIVRLGNVFVEYSGQVPDQAALDSYLNPPPRAKPKDDPALTPVAGAAPVTRAEFESLKALLGKELP